MEYLRKLDQLRRLRADMSRRIAKAEQADNSYAHNDMLLQSLERELESLEEQIRELESEGGAK